jgi:Tol biopolymer transport system component
MALGASLPAWGQEVIERVSLGPGGVESNGYSHDPVLSADGRFVAFTSNATNLVAGDTNRRSDVFVRDRETGTTERVSLGTNGRQGNGNSGEPALSADGRFVAFISSAGNLVPDDTNGIADVFVHDRRTGATERVSIGLSGSQPNSYSEEPALSADGRIVAFTSRATNLVPSDTNNAKDVFVHDRRTRVTQRAGAHTAPSRALSGPGGAGPHLRDQWSMIAGTQPLGLPWPGKMSSRCIMPISSCVRAWQCMTKHPTVSGSK